MQPANELRKIKSFLRNQFAREELGDAPAAAAPAEPRRRFVALLFRREPLPPELACQAPPRDRYTGAGPSLLGALFGRETLPEDPLEPPPPRRRGLAGALFAPEHLPELGAAPARPARAAWLRWLFRFERLDPP
jgi:hypothetical protein